MAKAEGSASHPSYLAILALPPAATQFLMPCMLSVGISVSDSLEKLGTLVKATFLSVKPNMQILIDYFWTSNWTELD